MDKGILIRAMTHRHSQVAVAPTEVNGMVDKLLTLMKLEVEPEEVTVQDVEYAKPKSCYYNVEEKTKRDGGKIHYGWAIWQSPYLCEAEHHAVWEDNNGALLDITPREPHHKTIMFVPDNDKQFKGKTIPNFRINASNNPLVDDMIEAFKVLDWVRQYEKRLNIDEVTSPKIVAEYVGTTDKPGPLSMIAHNLETFYLLGNKMGSKCYCNSLKAYSTCHHQSNKRNLSIYKQNVITSCGQLEI